MKDTRMISRLLRTVSSRRAVLGAGAILPLAPLAASTPAAAAQHPTTHNASHDGGMTTVGTVDHERNRFDPHDLLTDWDTGTVESDDAESDGLISTFLEFCLSPPKMDKVEVFLNLHAKYVMLCIQSYRKNGKK